MNRLTACIVGTVATVGILFGTVIAVPHAASPDGGPLTLHSIRELRVQQFAKADDAGMMMFSEEPSLSVTFGVALPEGTRLLQVVQPESVTAKDSTGRDLSKIEPNFWDELEYVEIEESFGGEMPPRLTVHLASPARAATTLDARMQFSVVTSSRTETVKADLTAQWQALKVQTADGTPLEARINEAWGSRAIEVRPATASDLIESLTMTVDGNELENFGWSSDGNTVRYDLSGEVPETGRVSFTVFAGLDTMPLELNLKKQPLP